MNYQLEIFTICNQILAESSNNNTYKHPLTIQYNDEIYNATAEFPPEIKCVYRIKAIASDDICKCNQCGKIHGKLGKEFCSRTCRDTYRKENAIKDYAQHNAIRMGEKRYSDKIEGYDYLVCQICGAKTGELLAHIRMHDITADEYKATYGLATLKTQKAIDNVKGEKNPGFNHGGKFSPFSEKFVNADTTDREELKKRAAKTRIDNGNDTTQLEYWLKQTNGDIEKASELLSKRQTTFSLEICIEKHGEEKGREIWKARQEKWSKSNKRTNYSQVSQRLFNEIMEVLPENLKESVYYATHNRPEMESYQNKEYILNVENTTIRPDFICLAVGKIIEFDGDYWHSDARVNPLRESKRDASIRNIGMDVLHIKERDYVKTKEQVIEQCLKFLTQ
jgi:hypothetical protein